MELPLLSPAASDIALPAEEEEPEMDSVEKEELDDSNRYRYPFVPLTELSADNSVTQLVEERSRP